MAIGFVLADEANKLIDKDYSQNTNTCLENRSELNTLDWESKDLLCSIECPCYYNQTNIPLPKNKTLWGDDKHPERVFHRKYLNSQQEYKIAKFIKKPRIQLSNIFQIT